MNGDSDTSEEGYEGHIKPYMFESVAKTSTSEHGTSRTTSQSPSSSGRAAAALKDVSSWYLFTNVSRHLKRSKMS